MGPAAHCVPGGGEWGEGSRVRGLTLNVPQRGHGARCALVACLSNNSGRLGAMLPADCSRSRAVIALERGFPRVTGPGTFSLKGKKIPLQILRFAFPDQDVCTAAESP